jgi:hypothetical protein
MKSSISRSAAWLIRPDVDPSWHTISEWAIGPPADPAALLAPAGLPLVSFAATACPSATGYGVELPPPANGALGGT